MKSVNYLSALLLTAMLAAGCDSAPPPPTEKPEPAKTETTATAEHKHDHDHDEHHHGKGPNGGLIFDFGKDHAELIVDHAAKSMTVLFIDGEDEKAKPKSVAAKEITVTTKESKTADGAAVPAMTITLTAQDEKEGKASKFTGTDPGLEKVAECAGTAIAEIDGKPAQGDFKEE